MKCLLLLLSTFGSARNIREQKNTNRGPTPDYIDDERVENLNQKNEQKISTNGSNAIVEARGPRPDYDDNPTFRSIGLRDAQQNHAAVKKRKISDFITKCRNGEVEDGTKSAWTNQKHKCNLEGRRGFRLSCQDRKHKREVFEGELCEPGQHMFSGYLEHNTKTYGYGTLFILDHGKRPFMDRSALGTVCMGRGSSRLLDDDNHRLCSFLGYKRVMTEDEIAKLTYSANIPSIIPLMINGQKLNVTEDDQKYEEYFETDNKDLHLRPYSHSNRGCLGHSTDLKLFCYGRRKPGFWTGWTSWSTCSMDNNVRTRFRTCQKTPESAKSWKHNCLHKKKSTSFEDFIQVEQCETDYSSYSSSCEGPFCDYYDEHDAHKEYDDFDAAEDDTESVESEEKSETSESSESYSYSSSTSSRDYSFNSYQSNYMNGLRLNR